MTNVIVYNPSELLISSVILCFGMIMVMILYAIIKGWIDNKRWEKNIYQILEQYRAKYGVDEGCELLMYKEKSE